MLNLKKCKNGVLIKVLKRLTDEVGQQDFNFELLLVTDLKTCSKPVLGKRVFFDAVGNFLEVTFTSHWHSSQELTTLPEIGTNVCLVKTKSVIFWNTEASLKWFCVQKSTSLFWRHLFKNLFIQKNHGFIHIRFSFFQSPLTMNKTQQQALKKKELVTAGIEPVTFKGSLSTRSPLPRSLFKVWWWFLSSTGRGWGQWYIRRCRRWWAWSWWSSSSGWCPGVPWSSWPAPGTGRNKGRWKKCSFIGSSWNSLCS